MTTVTFDEAKVRRGQPGNPGQFAAKKAPAPGGSLRAPLGAPLDAPEIWPYEGQAAVRRVGQPADVSTSSMVLDAERQTGDVTSFHEEHELDDGSYLTSVYYAYPVEQPTGETFVALETERFVAGVPGAYAAHAASSRDEEHSSRDRTLGGPFPSDQGPAASKTVLEDVWAYQSTFGAAPFTGKYDPAHVGAFYDALPQIRSAAGLD